MFFTIFLLDDVELYDEFYDEFDNRVRIEQSMNMIFFGPPSSFLRLDPESMLHILTYTKNHLIPISRAILAWDVITGMYGTLYYILTSYAQRNMR